MAPGSPMFSGLPSTSTFNGSHSTGTKARMSGTSGMILHLLTRYHIHCRWDLWWTPVWAGSYWTSSVQYRALRAGARLSRLIGRETNGLGYDGVASSVLQYLQESILSLSLSVDSARKTEMLTL